MAARSDGQSSWLLIVLLAVVGVVAMPLNATTLIRVGLEELTAANETIVLGEVLDADSYWNEAGTFILTDVRIGPIEVLKGNSRQSEIIVTVMGGTVGDLTTLIVGGAELIPGRPYVLFLSRGSLPGVEKVFTVREHSQGVFDVVNTTDGPRAVSQVHTPLLPDSRGVSEALGGATGLRLEVMMASIRSLVGEEEGQR